MLLDALRVLRQVDQPVGATLQPAKRDNEFPVRIVSICGKLSITVEKIPAGGATLRIYKPNGTIVREVKAEVAQTLDIKSLANGVYYYTLISAHAMSKPAVIRIVK
jgi:hypothetical protein